MRRDGREEISAFTQKLCQQGEDPDKLTLLHIKFYTLIYILICVFVCACTHVHMHLSVHACVGQIRGQLIGVGVQGSNSGWQAL